jgi:hydroxyacylglutathione hydrolase
VIEIVTIETPSNPALTLGEDRYVTALVEGLDAYPAYYAHMAAANAAGPDAPDPAPPARVTASELGRWISAGEWVADLRDRRAFAAGHIPGSFSFEYGDSFATYLGWLIPWGTSLTLVGETGRPGTPSPPSTTTSAVPPVRACLSPGRQGARPPQR